MPVAVAIMVKSSRSRAMLRVASEPVVTMAGTYFSSCGSSDSAAVPFSTTTRSGLRATMASTLGSVRVPTSVTVAGSFSAEAHVAYPFGSATPTGLTPRVTSCSASAHSVATTRVAGAGSVTALPRASVTVTGPAAAAVVGWLAAGVLGGAAGAEGDEADDGGQRQDGATGGKCGHDGMDPSGRFVVRGVCGLPASLPAGCRLGGGGEPPTADRPGVDDAVGIGPDLDGQPVGGAEPLLREHLDGRSGRDHAAPVEEDDMVGDRGRLVEVVQHDADGDTVVVGEVLDEVQELGLVAQVEVVVGSSRRSTPVSCARHDASQTRCRSPPESSSTGRSAIAVTPVSSMARAIARGPSASRSPPSVQPTRRYGWRP